MSEKRFYLLSYKNYPIYDSVEDKEYNARFRKQREKLCDLLNEWVAKCNQLESENEQLRQSRDYLEKAIERAYEEKPYPTEEDINRIYAELEKEIDV